MRRFLLTGVVIWLAGSSLLLAQESGSAESSAVPERLLAQPTPQTGEAPDPPIQQTQTDETPVLPQPRTGEMPVPPPGLFAPPPVPSPLAPTAAPPPPVLAEPCLDSFATRFWIGADYLMWWTKGDNLPVLVTSGSPTDPVPGALGQAGTQPLFGGDYNSRLRSGVRLRGGYWLTPDQTFGLDATFFFLGGQSARFSDSSDGIPVLARPFYNVDTGHQDAYVVAYPGRQSGDIFGALSTRLWGADTDFRSMLFRGASYQVNLLGGFRFLDLHDSLGIQERNTFYPQVFNAPLSWSTSADHFHTSNQFYGGQLGADMMWTRGRFFVDVLAKVALGVSAERAGINGWTSYSNSAGQSGYLNVGELAQPSNIGSYGKNAFAVVPEFGLNFGYAVTRHLRLTFGYTFLYWSNVFRAGDQIDPGVNPTELAALAGQGILAGPARPNFTMQSTDFWAQGLNFGLQFRY
ncbi:MAG: BBP7 family outer membrane beta-barrel protein [Gemmataceae bacterium]